MVFLGSLLLQVPLSAVKIAILLFYKRTFPTKKFAAWANLALCIVVIWGIIFFFVSVLPRGAHVRYNSSTLTASCRRSSNCVSSIPSAWMKLSMRGHVTTSFVSVWHRSGLVSHWTSWCCASRYLSFRICIWTGNASGWSLAFYG
ncbi:hypothetical protein F4780DRAFT_729865 [Xylariomycetidae sp. FL0641]|nr:hypothetical protein F4780DRAFT_729865 [Xylariomycetidae sp. FL0641]